MIANWLKLSPSGPHAGILICYTPMCLPLSPLHGFVCSPSPSPFPSSTHPHVGPPAQSLLWLCSILLLLTAFALSHLSQISRFSWFTSLSS
ncbi:hypothetical protein BD311DRAFT_752490 [Dichomitus squalens]|uniref:Uncharacterized protein n=1 Tax=Dichomitus squalens TaxID=114155 RepID=A0A4Q9MTX5_9APHY|nr:hypothetical protein BD311DRAFT_752490 [Dichomitus squalens]